MMNSKLLLLSFAGLCGLVAACHDDHNSPPAPAPQSQSLNTAQVLTLAQKTSETSLPMVVNGGALTLNDTSETGAPITVNTM
jgi:hypothetical protein